MRAWPFIVLAACGSRDPLPDLETDDGTGDDDVPDIDGPPPTECLIENVLSDLVGTTKVIQCGRARLSDAAAVFLAVRDCILDSEAAHVAYTAQWASQGADSRIETAFFGATTATGWTTLNVFYDGSPGGSGSDNDPHTQVWRCEALEAVEPCDSLQPDLCLRCTDLTAVMRCPPID